MNYVKTRRELESFCNICKKKTNLSFDHVPPQGGVELGPVEIEHVFQRLSDGKRNYQVSQNGVKFRTICKSCNEKLGQKYDPTLNRFSIGIGSYLKTELYLPDVVKFRTKPLSLMKGLIGHLLAARAHFHISPFEDRLREIVFDDSQGVPQGVNVFYWIYPYHQTTIIRDIGMLSISRAGRKGSAFSILKYFPIAYLLTELPSYDGLEELSQYRDLELLDEVEIPIRLRPVKSIDWPENTEDNNILLVDTKDTLLKAKPRRK